jgi:hypothetical protein
VTAESLATVQRQVIKFQRFHDFYVEARGAGFYEKAETFLQDLIATYEPQSILEIGSGANPTLSVDYVHAAPFTYTTNDVSDDELRKAHQAYQRLRLDVCYDPIPDHALNAYDLIFMLEMGGPTTRISSTCSPREVLPFIAFLRCTGFRLWPIESCLSL